MKKLILFIALILMVVTSFGQPLKKGNTIGLHVSTIFLNPDVTMNQYIAFCKTKLFPAFEENMPGIKCFLAKGIKGEYLDSYSFIMFWESKSIMEKYFKPDGSSTEAGKASFDKMKPVTDEWNKMGRIVDKYTDWEIQ
jgi:hypothetical protein